MRTRLQLYYILDKDRNPVPVKDVLEWAKGMREDDRKVAQDFVTPGPSKDEVHISTVFIGIDHRFIGEGPPILFETMIFGGKHDDYQERYSTWKEAEAGHKKALDLVLDVS